MASLSLKNVCKVYSNGFEAVKDFNLDVEDKEFVIFVGPSGCGKSTTLRMIAGLEEISSGELWIDGKVMNDVEPKDRDIAMVFQNYALYPHMTVYDNMAFGLKLRKVPKDEIKQKLRKLQESLTLRNYLIVSQRLYQVDRDSVLPWVVQSFVILRYSLWMSLYQTWMQSFVFRCVSEISKLHQRLGATIIYVTHDQTEAMTLGTRIVVMKDGVVQQVDTHRTYTMNLTTYSLLDSSDLLR